jgi:hypothetical protein
MQEEHFYVLLFFATHVYLCIFFWYLQFFLKKIQISKPMFLYMKIW